MLTKLEYHSYDADEIDDNSLKKQLKEKIIIDAFWNVANPIWHILYGEIRGGLNQQLEIDYLGLNI